MGGRPHRECVACGVSAPRGRGCPDPRWCGACGERLVDAATDGHADAGRAATRDPRLRWVAAAAGAAVLAAVVGAGAGAASQRLAAASRDSLGVDLDAGDVTEAVTGPASDAGPVCLRTPRCVAWVEPASIAGRTPTATVADGLTLVRVRDGLEARDTEDGGLRWRAPLTDAADGSGYLPVHAAAELALVTETGDAASRLLALDLATGTDRWELPGVTEVSDVLHHGEVLLALVSGLTDPPVTAGTTRRSAASEQLVAIDTTTGAVRWSADGELFHLLPDGAVVVDGGEIAVLDAAGQDRWRRTLGDAAAPAWLDVTGRFVRLFDGRGNGGPVWSLTDGTELDHDGELVPVADLAAEPRDPFRSEVAAVVGRRPDGGTDLTLLDGDEVAWHVTFERIGCCAPLQLEGDHITVPAADGGRWQLARADGEVLGRTGPPVDRRDASTVLPTYGGVSVEQLDVADTTTSELALVEDGRRTARLPAGAWPVGATDDVVVVRSDTWVAAIRRDTGVAAE